MKRLGLFFLLTCALLSLTVPAMTAPQCDLKETGARFMKATNALEGAPTLEKIGDSAGKNALFNEQLAASDAYFACRAEADAVAKKKLAKQ